VAQTTYQVTLGERTLRVRLRHEHDAVYAQVDGAPEVRVQLSALRAPLWSLVAGDRRSELMAVRTVEGVDLTIGGIGYHAEVLDEAHARLAQVAAARGGGHVRRDLKAPMPGLVVKVLVEPGQDVTPGQPLVVLQAMKMENELSLPRGGTVSTVGVAAGQTVEAGQILASVD
jgi:biotin carboxyl carrier protein